MKIAQELGLTLRDYERFLNGEVPESVSRRFGATTEAIHEFVNGGTSFRLAHYCGCQEDDLQDLRRAIGREGAIGLLIGLCLCGRK
jgi:hypothetical protein